MKNLLICFFCLFITLNLLAQNNRMGNFVANMPSVYPISGAVTLAESGGVLTVTFENNFSTVQGLQLEVFLSKTNTINFNTDVKISTAPLDQGSATGTPITGTMSFAVPANVNAYEFDNVLIQCTSASVLWGYANLCESNLDLASSTLPTDNYTAAQSIACSTDLASASTVSFQTANDISLNAGFTVPLSTEFTTLLGATYGCVIE